METVKRGRKPTIILMRKPVGSLQKTDAAVRLLAEVLLAHAAAKQERMRAALAEPGDPVRGKPRPSGR